MIIDYTITIGNLIEIASILGGGALVMLTMRSDIAVLKKEDEMIRTDVEGIQDELKQIGDVLIAQADQNRRILHLEEEMRDLRHGRAFIRAAANLDSDYA
jgi:hypothetical protein